MVEGLHEQAASEGLFIRVGEVDILEQVFGTGLDIEPVLGEADAQFGLVEIRCLARVAVEDQRRLVGINAAAMNPLAADMRHKVGNRFEHIFNRGLSVHLGELGICRPLRTVRVPASSLHWVQHGCNPGAQFAT